ncbi:MAG: Hsp20/alpha crystallin family protein [Polyangiaceae bacterium]|nr:Hsp20/alpha crystallin family protein [Polyangiaceae bacterium]
MRTRWSEADWAFATMDELRRRIDQLFSKIDGGGIQIPLGWPRIGIFDNGLDVIVTAEVPGLTQADIDLSVTQDVLTLRGDRPPDGDSAHLGMERAPFSRSILLPCRVDSDRAAASISNGVLRITLPKVRDVEPRAAVQAS